MIRPAAFVADLVDVGLDCPAATAVVRAAIDVHDVARFLSDVGVPPTLAAYRAAPETAPAVLILPCRRARHPERDVDVAAEAALDLLERFVRDRLASDRRLAGAENLALRLVRLTGEIAESADVASVREAAHGL
ncbi:hypothetical protein [Methylorubrum zatmanii]